MVLVRRLAGVVVIAVVVAALAVVAAVGLVPLVTGASTYTVLTGSMRPALPVGTVVVVRPTPVEQIAVGEVVTFLAHDPGTSATRVVTHRVIGIDPGPVLRTRATRTTRPTRAAWWPPTSAACSGTPCRGSGGSRPRAGCWWRAACCCCWWARAC